MPSISRLVTGVLTAVSVLAIWGGGHAVARTPTPPPAGITLSPATLTLTLPTGQTQAAASFTMTNSYSTPVALRFDFEQDGQAADAPGPSIIPQLSLGTGEVLLAPGASASQTVTLRDSEQLSPGSQQLNLVVTQSNAGQGNVGVLSRIRMPLIIIKEDGAVSRIALASLGGGGVNWSVPNTISATLHNSGNMIAIPRGVITVTGPGGRVLGQGTLNVASTAVVPGDDVMLNTAITPLGQTLLPGKYTIHLAYSLGGGAPAKTATVAFIYITWWHILAGAGLLWGVYWLWQYVRSVKRQRARPAKGPPRHAVVVGRDSG